MTYGQNPYGRTPWGGDLSADGFTLVAADPVPFETGVLPTATISFTLHTSGEFDPSTLGVDVNGTAAIIGGQFQPTFSGSITYTVGFVEVVINQPGLPKGDQTTIDLSVALFGAALGSLSYLFYVDQAEENLFETLFLAEGLQIDGGLFFSSIDGYTVQIDLPDEMQLAEAVLISSYNIIPTTGAVPLTIDHVTPRLITRQSGTEGQVIAPLGALTSHVFDTSTGTFNISHIGDYLFITGTFFDGVDAYRIQNISGSQVTLDRAIPATDPLNGTFVPGVGFTSGTGQLEWTHTSAVSRVTLSTTKSTRDKLYVGFIKNLKHKISGELFSASGEFTSNAAKPQVTGAELLVETGTVFLDFGEDMRLDAALLSPSEYSFTGPTDVSIYGVRSVDSSTVALSTTGLEDGTYTLTVNATGTPKDIAGNPIDPSFNQTIFLSSVPLIARSVFVDKGPIAKPALTLQTGLTATINTANTITMPGASITSSMIGLYVTLTGTVTNGGSFRILAVLSATKVRLDASFSLPDISNGSISWQVFDPRDGEIADDPSDVIVRINGTPTVADAVVGLLGQIVLPTAPVHGDTVDVDYSWVSNPVVDFRRMNSKEFRFNNWNRDNGRPTDASQHKYRYNNTMVEPGTFVALDMRATIDQPLVRDLKYRAYERAYTAVFNDPNLLLFNSPVNKIAFPVLERTIASSFVNYQATSLPEAAPEPWTRYGTGTATVNIDELIVRDTTTGPFPTGNPIYWSRPIDLTFPHVFAAAWSLTINTTSITEGVFTGIAAGYSNDSRAIVVGYLKDGSTAKIGFLKAGYGSDPSSISAWTGGLDTAGLATGLPVTVDWSSLHSYRIYRDRAGTVRLYLDGSIVEILKVEESEMPYLEELNDPFNSLEGVFFGSLSREATNVSTWDFLRYTILPLNPLQSELSSYASYEGTTTPEVASDPWTPVGSHGTETILSNDYLLLDSTSATDLTTESVAGYISGDFRGYTRLEPLLQAVSDAVLDVNVSLRTFTHGITPNAVMAAIDDGQYLLQLCFFPDKASPKFSYGGRSLPEAFAPYYWEKDGTLSPTMQGQNLHIVDNSTIGTAGIVYHLNDNETVSSDDRIVGYLSDYMLEFRVQVTAHTSDIGGFAGVMTNIYDSDKAVGIMLQDVSGTKYVTLHSDGVPVSGGQFAFNWDDGEFHTYRLAKSTTGNLVSLFADAQLLGFVGYNVFVTTSYSPVGVVSFGSSTPASAQATSTSNWAYCNTWRVQTAPKRFVGIWKGFESDSLLGYHLPVKVTGRQASVAGNGLGDPSANFIAQGVSASGDQLIVDTGPNKGVYTIQSRATTTLTVSPPFPFGPSAVDYRIAAEVDWTVPRRYRLVRDPGGGIALFTDTNPTPLVRLSYSGTDLPVSRLGVPRLIAGDLPSVVFGAFDPTNISQTSWDFVRYGITRSFSEKGAVPHHQVMNQRNVIASFEHHRTNIAHTHTDFWSESEGIPPQTDPDLLRNTSLTAYTLLNEGTPLVPSTQTYEVRRPTPVYVSLVSFNSPVDLLNDQGFLLNTSEREIKLLVPDDVLYDSLHVIETQTGSTSLIAPFSDESEPYDLGTFQFQNTTCLNYDGTVLPENDTTASTPWVLDSDTPAHAYASAFSGVLTYGTDGVGTKTIYRNVTPLPDQISLQTEVTFRLKLLNDSSGGLGDTQVRFGWSSVGMTMALAFITSPIGQRYVLVLDLNNNTVLGGVLFDFNDGAFHNYRLVRDVETASIQVFIDN